MNIDYWIQVLRNDPEALHSFCDYLTQYISESSKQFKTASSMEQVSKIQGKLEALDKLQRDFNEEHLKEQEHAIYQTRYGNPSTG